MIDCKRFDRCGANICPLDPDLERRTWFPDEEICRRKDFQQHPAIVAQKRIQRNKPARWWNREKPITGRELVEFGKRLLATREKLREHAKRRIAEGKILPWQKSGV